LDELIENNQRFRFEHEQSLYESLIGQYIPIYLPNEKCWGVDTGHGVELGCITYVLGELCLDGLLYHHTDSKHRFPNHEHRFDISIENLEMKSENFTITGYEDEYSIQEIRFIMNIQNNLLKIKKQGKPLSKKELISNREVSKNNL